MASDADILAIAGPMVERDEGCRLVAYPDPLSGGEPWTIGYGCTGPGIGPGAVWSQDEAQMALTSRLKAIVAGLDGAIPWWRGLMAPRAAVLVDMAFNLGVEGLLAFHNTLCAVRQGNWLTASADMLLSRWAQEVPDRAERLAAQMRTGVVR